MSDQGNGPSISYTVVTSQRTKAVLEKFYAHTVLVGKRQTFMAALQKIGERLAEDPLNFGDPLYRLPSLHLRVFHAVVQPLIVYYAVHEEKRLVFIRSFKITI